MAQNIKSLLWYQKYQKNKKVYYCLGKHCTATAIFFMLVYFYQSDFPLSSWTLRAAFHRRRHPSGKNTRIHIKACLHNSFYTLCKVTWTDSSIIHVPHSQNCVKRLYIPIAKCHIPNLPFVIWMSPQKKKKRKENLPHLISVSSYDAEATSQPKIFSIHGNRGHDSLVYSFQRRCHSSYCACFINHVEDRATVIWCQPYYLG